MKALKATKEEKFSQFPGMPQIDSEKDTNNAMQQ